MPILQAPPWRRDEPLAKRTSFQIGGPAAYFAEPCTEQEMMGVLAEAAERRLPLAVLGGGCNSLVLDEGFPGLVLSTARFEPSRLDVRAAGSRPSVALVTVSAGMSLSRFSSELAARGLAGLEFLSQIPGTVGGAVRMNAGFSRTGDRAEAIARALVRVRVASWEGASVVLERSELEFGYRRSSVTGVVLEAAFELAYASPDAVRDAMNDNYRYRASVQDLKFPSAGSVFKNPDPPALSVGRMVDALGLKGTCAGGAMISAKHGNFIVNRGGARARDVLALASLIERAVLETYGIVLEKEIRLVGPAVS